MLIDLHAHESSQSGAFQIQVLTPLLSAPDYSNSSHSQCETLEQFESWLKICGNKKKYFTIGGHPWVLANREPDEAFNFIRPFLELAVTSPYFFSLGEVGLDSAVNIKKAKQEEFLLLQLKWAKDHQVSSLMLHNVKSEGALWQNIDTVFKGAGFEGTIIWHDYNGDFSLFHAHLDRHPHARQIFSLGRNFLRQDSTVSKSYFRFIEWCLDNKIEPPIFFESDAGPWKLKHEVLASADQKIQFLYHHACKILELELPQLEAILQARFSKYFPGVQLQ